MPRNFNLGFEGIGWPLINRMAWLVGSRENNKCRLVWRRFQLPFSIRLVILVQRGLDDDFRVRKPFAGKENGDIVGEEMNVGRFF
jgi:hypothetical protein